MMMALLVVMGDAVDAVVVIGGSSAVRSYDTGSFHVMPSSDPASGGVMSFDVMSTPDTVSSGRLVLFHTMPTSDTGSGGRVVLPHTMPTSDPASGGGVVSRVVVNGGASSTGR